MGFWWPVLPVPTAAPPPPEVFEPSWLKQTLFPQNSSGRGAGVLRKHLERSDVQILSVKELNALRGSLSQAVQGAPTFKSHVTPPPRSWKHSDLVFALSDLSSELVSCLHIRDQLRTEQDAMLLEVQDLTSLWGAGHPSSQSRVRTFPPFAFAFHCWKGTDAFWSLDLSQTAILPLRSREVSSERVLISPASSPTSDLPDVSFPATDVGLDLLTFKELVHAV